MPKVPPLPSWEGEDVYVIGGGESLRGFKFSQLVGKNTIGCNQAFLLGAEICKIVAFGDENFWNVFSKELESYGGWVVTNYPGLVGTPEWLCQFGRLDFGLCVRGDDSLAWNCNTGSMALNLALVLGARRVMLLGFDLHPGQKSSHWHDREIDTPTREHYARFSEGFFTVKAEIPNYFPGVEVYNVGDGGSELKCFPGLTYEEAGLVL